MRDLLPDFGSMWYGDMPICAGGGSPPYRKAGCGGSILPA